MNKIVIALGGNALGKTPIEQLELVKNTAKQIVEIVKEGNEFVWVPVADVTTMYGTLKGGTKAGKIYDWTSLDSNRNPAKLNWTEETTNGKTEMSISSNTGYREPDTVSSYDGNANYLNIIKRQLMT